MTLEMERDLESRLTYKFRNSSLLEQALTHRSFHFENRAQSLGHNERLEFLGDAVLDLGISAELMRLYPDESEGVLSKWRASLVNEASLAERSAALDIGRHLKVGRGEHLAQAAHRPRLMASVFEAIVGAIFQDGGWEPVSAFLASHFAEMLKLVSLSHDYASDYKTRLQELVQKETHAPPDYRVTGTDGPDHHKTFFVEVSVRGEVLAVGSGTSRKQAEQEAAKVALALRKVEA